ncbi:2-isopropylmalate synthase [Phycisphaera mikurensis]|uniref:2-isopropylmalate synthase n=1 Tax=Phycisphaera mikurensis (strain NBRC 102666 / KCTC 22515 / FYK2301M01) TaxID=1142394 RepID=I0IHS5_PHYMF|nr:2-isopropylmalate synthase [Phycisphaera mikurensis]MBB6441058.1 2-isopropylmalate synthase [Phycisphaera mikurensis]BAM04813.1 2-isopropylmalate synthase [Phycisphaera mikurensis NBRC 102666]
MEASPAPSVKIFDTTLRDGEQSPGASLDLREKLEIARQLEKLGVDVIEAGFPITSDGDFEAVRAIADELTGPVVCGLARCVEADIDRAGEAVRGARGGARIHVFCATSKIHREHKLRKGTAEIVALSRRSIERARGFVDDVEFSPEDASRTEPEVLVEICAAAIEAGATTLNLPDTVGYAVPAEYGRIFAMLRAQLPQIDRDGVVLSCHCHDDLGLAIANTLAAIENGARQAEVTVNGIGERAGNAALEELVMALAVRADAAGGGGVNTGIRRREIYKSSRMVSTLTGLSVQRNKAVVGENAFAHESGIHQDGMLKNPETYEIMDPRSIGVPESKLVLGKHSGRAALADRLRDLGIEASGEVLQAVYDRFKTLADRKKEVHDEDLEAIVDDLHASAAGPAGTGRGAWTLHGFQAVANAGTPSFAFVELVDPDGETRREAAFGDGPIEACYSAVQLITGVTASLDRYAHRAVTGGKDAQGEVRVELSTDDGRKARGRGLSTDTIEAAVKAYVAAMNRLATRAAEPASVPAQP